MEAFYLHGPGYSLDLGRGNTVWCFLSSSFCHSLLTCHSLLSPSFVVVVVSPLTFTFCYSSFYFFPFYIVSIVYTSRSFIVPFLFCIIPVLSCFCQLLLDETDQSEKLCVSLSLGGSRRR